MNEECNSLKPECVELFCVGKEESYTISNDILPSMWGYT
eukprot:CAMPEP_0170350650 /NCGR_PEP_ID=MMETSP0116_2-20130129/76623_1 /TAXON_ID=400756 /ORGANISM="Durinskia baltica, Strain CSIRO CS-38" /LENGTH=38 /DNA_ID= /DNA_START= /DNA_END= /DNA_ORIENTATION=